MVEASSNCVFHIWNKLQEVFCSTPSSSSPLVLPKLNKLHEMVYEVNMPHLEEKPDLEIVLFHGLRLKDCEEPHITTWMSEDNSQMWPKTWLVEEFPKARILTVSYDSAAKMTSKVGRLDMFLTTENLLSALTSNLVRVGDAQCPIVLVGHCLGGILLKELCLNANKVLSEKREETRGMQRIHDFLHNLSGMFFYGTPHLGSLLGDKVKDLDGSLVAEMEILNAWSARKNGSFCDLKTRYKWHTYGMGETQKTFVDCLGKYIHVVPEASSRENMDMYYSLDADHFTLCKPDGKQGTAFSFLIDFLHKICEEYVLRSGDEADAVSRRGYVIDFHGRRADKVKQMLATPNAHTVFIVGLSGIGKTTLAQQVFHDISHTFTTTCFIYLDKFEGRSNSSDEVLRKIEIELKRQGRGSLPDHFNVPRYLKGKKVLIILDNVQSESQLKALGREIWLEGTNSRVVVTTPYSYLGSPSNTFEVKYLHRHESWTLFHHYAFADRATPHCLRHSVGQVLDRCGNFPLSLKILGSYLSVEDLNDPNLWRDLLVRLENAEEVATGPDYELWARLKPCYDVLQPSEQDMFLDVAVVFCGLPLNFVEHIWNACRRSSTIGWRNLKRGFLVSQDLCGRVWMHQLLRYLGQSIACPQNRTIDKWRRIVGGVSERNFIAKCEGILNTLSLELQVQGNERLTMRNTTLPQYAQLEYLIMDGVDMTEGTVELPRSLVYLKWKGALFETCPVDFNRLEKLAVLDLQFCKSMRSLPASVVTAKRLKWLDLEGCLSLTELPEGLHEFSDLEFLNLSMTQLTNISSEVGKLKNLRYFRANQTQLARVPESIGGLRQLQSLDISHTFVEVLPESIGDLQSLTILNAEKTLLSSLPNSIGNLGMLKNLNISDTVVEVLPESIGDLQSLTILNAEKTLLSSLPNSLGHIGMLRSLNIRNTAVRVLPESVGDLKFLETLCADRSLLSALPDSIGLLQNLQYMSLTYTPMKSLPESLGNVVNLKQLILYSTPLETLPDSICLLRGLAYLDLRDTQVSSLPGAFGEIDGLRCLSLQGSRVRASLQTLAETFKNIDQLGESWTWKRGGRRA